MAAMKLQQVVLNLVRNAIEAMSSSPPEDRQLTLKTGLEGSTVLIRVQDSGCGVSAAVRKRIFDPFFSTRTDGMGLGLSICSTLIEQSGGKLRLVESDAKGAIFELAIPAVE
jgi:C4-dicarboxylate-specific signal transduction histidine kinase